MAFVRVSTAYNDDDDAGESDSEDYRSKKKKERKKERVQNVELRLLRTKCQCEKLQYVMRKMFCKD